MQPGDLCQSGRKSLQSSVDLYQLELPGIAVRSIDGPDVFVRRDRGLGQEVGEAFDGREDRRRVKLFDDHVFEKLARLHEGHGFDAVQPSRTASSATRDYSTSFRWVEDSSHSDDP